jgi:carboxyl-terminal processing protease
MSRTIKMAAAILILLFTISFAAGCFQVKTPASDQNLESVVQAWQLILDNYVTPEKLDGNLLGEAAIKGIIEALDDPHTAYVNADQYESALDQLEGKFEGIGAYVAAKDGQIVVMAPMPDSPAARAGIKPGDLILAIDGRSTSEMSLPEAVLNMRGPKGTSVTLLVRHQEETEPEEIKIVRDEVEVDSVYFEMKGDIAYISINSFTERTADELSPVLSSIAEQNPTGIIVDLRSNPGGLLEIVIDVAGYFLKEGVVVKVKDNNGNITSSSVESNRLVTELPMVVLVDEYTASGGEVLAGALQDYGRATIAGTRTFGKGSVNKLYQLENGAGLYLTVARWLTPKDRPIEGVGLQPDYELKLDEVDAIQWAIDYLEGPQ